MQLIRVCHSSVAALLIRVCCNTALLHAAVLRCDTALLQLCCSSVAADTSVPLQIQLQFCSCAKRNFLIGVEKINNNAQCILYIHSYQGSYLPATELINSSTMPNASPTYTLSKAAICLATELQQRCNRASCLATEPIHY